jgi:hypothetical protein
MTPLNPWGDERGYPSHRHRHRHRLQTPDQILGRRQARRLSRRFACVGVPASPERLQAVLAGAPVAAAELTAVNFAFIAIHFMRDERLAKFKRLRRRGIRSLIFVGLVFVTLHFLLCLGYVLFSLTQLASPV